MRFSIRSIFLVGVLLAGCRGTSPNLPARIVLVTLPGVGLTQASDLPSLQGLALEADWAGSGIAASSRIQPAAASLFTGLTPWNHQVLNRSQSYLRDDLFTLGEALTALGYRSSALSSSPWTSNRKNYKQGFPRFFRLLTPAFEERLVKSSLKKEFFWIQLRTESREGPQKAPSRTSSADIDAELNRVLVALEASGSWSETLLVVTAEHGPPSADRETPFFPLYRSSLEVPLVIRLPENSERPIAVPEDQPVATRRLWATLVEAGGGSSIPAAASSLYHDVDRSILSELYRNQGANLFSLIVGKHQLLRRVAYLPETRAGARDQTHFASTLPFSGLGSHESLLLQWEPDGSYTLSNDEAKRSELEKALEGRWGTFVDRERTPAAEAALRPNGPPQEVSRSRSQRRPKQRTDH